MKKSLLAVVVGIVMLIPSVAFADSTCQAYSQKTCTTTSNTTTSPTPSTTTSPTSNTVTSSTGAPSPTEATTTSNTGTLPFTGLDVAALMVGAAVLLGGGLVMRYLSRDQQS